MSLAVRWDSEKRAIVISTPEGKAHPLNLADAEDLRLSLTRAIWRLRAQVRAEKKKATRSGDAA